MPFASKRRTEGRAAACMSWPPGGARLVPSRSREAPNFTGVLAVRVGTALLDILDDTLSLLFALWIAVVSVLEAYLLRKPTARELLVSEVLLA